MVYFYFQFLQFPKMVLGRPKIEHSKEENLRKLMRSLGLLDSQGL